MSFTPNPSQKKAIEARGTNVLVFASAGGGKTTVLIDGTAGIIQYNGKSYTDEVQNMLK